MSDKDVRICLMNGAGFRVEATRNGFVARFDEETLRAFASLMPRMFDRDGGRVRFELKTKTVDVPARRKGKR